jgi:hypothetical protein
MNNCKVITTEIYNRTKIKSEEVIQEMISIKIKEYEEFIPIQSPERVIVC